MTFPSILKLSAAAALSIATTVSAADDHAGHDHGDHAHQHAAKTVAVAKAVVAPKVDLKEAVKVVSYGHGHYIGTQLAANKDMVQIEIFIEGLKAAVAGKPNKHDQATLQKAMSALQKVQMEKQKAVQAKQQAENIGHIKSFLAEKLTETKSGLAYKVIKKGEGSSPKATDTVTVHYTGYLTDGSKFDSSVDRGQPTSFPLNGVIKGWTEGLQLMNVGAKYRFKIPGDLAYGPQGNRGIPPNATLVFDVELIAIQGAK